VGVLAKGWATQMVASKVFGPFYPAALQAAVNHAELFCGVLSDYEHKPPVRSDAFLAWLSGRDGEVERVVENMVNDWRGRSVSDDEAAMQIELYLRRLHEDLVHHGVLTDKSGIPRCCINPFSSTVRATPFSTSAQTAPVDTAPMVLVDTLPSRNGTVIQPLDESIEGMLHDVLRDRGAR
jgi:hypothetical protein